MTSLISEIIKEFETCMVFGKSNISKMTLYGLFIVPIAVALLTLNYWMNSMNINYTWQKPRFYQDIYLITNEYWKMGDTYYSNGYITILITMWGIWMVLNMMMFNYFQFNMSKTHTLKLLQYVKIAHIYILVPILILFIMIDNIENYNLAKHKSEFEDYLNEHVIDYGFIKKLQLEAGKSNKTLNDFVSNYSYTKSSDIDMEQSKKQVATLLILKQIANNRYNVVDFDNIKWLYTININMNTLYETTFIENSLKNTTNLNDYKTFCEETKREIDVKIGKIKQLKNTTSSKQLYGIYLQIAIFAGLTVALFYNKK